MVREITTEWTGPQGSFLRTVMYFGDTEKTAAEQRFALGEFWESLLGVTSYAYRWTIATTGREINTVTGGLLGEWSDELPYSGIGTNTDGPVPDASQALIRWTTGQVVDGRFLRGRTFFPAVPRDEITNGNLSNPMLTALQGAASAFIDSGVDFGIWHRPKQGALGLFSSAVGSSVWNELAVLRRRRG